MTDTKRALARNIARLRAQAGETAAELAAALDISPAAVSEWENARKMPRATTIDALAEHYGVTRESLIADPDAAPIDLDDLLHDVEPLTFAGRELTSRERRLISRLARAALGEGPL